MSLLGLDIGTTGCKAIVFSEEGTILGSAYREYSLIYPRPGWSELNPEAVWHNVEDAIREAVTTAGQADPVRALAPSTQGEAVCPIASDGKILANSIVTFDNRTVPQALQMQKVVSSATLYAMTGQPLHPMGTIFKIAWWKQNEPELYHRTSKFLCYGDFALQRLGVEPVMDTSLAARTMAYNIHTGGWETELLQVFDIDEAKLPRVAPSGTAVGSIPNDVCDRLNLPRGVVAVTGAHDQPCGALGAGAVVPGTAMYAIGTVECVTPCLDSFLPGLGDRGFPCYPHALNDKFVALGFNFGGGSILRWFRDNFAQPEVAQAQATGADVYDLLLESVDTQPGNLLLLPHFAGTGTPWLDTESKGAIVGLTLSSSRNDVLKAILEGTTYEIAYNVSEMLKAGVTISELRAIGGGAKSAKWLQMKADILGVSLVTLNVSEAACLGSAILAGSGAGVYANPAATAAALAKPIRSFEPNPTNHAEHERKLALYRELYPSVKEISHRLV